MYITNNNYIIIYLYNAYCNEYIANTKLILQNFIALQETIKQHQIYIWCDHLPEWQMLITNLLQSLIFTEDESINLLHHLNHNYFEETLEYYDKLTEYFYNNDNIQELLLRLFESIKQIIALKNDFILQYNTILNTLPSHNNLLLTKPFYPAQLNNSNNVMLPVYLNEQHKILYHNVLNNMKEKCLYLYNKLVNKMF